MATWPHAPNRNPISAGVYFVTAGTLGKERLFCDKPRLDLLETLLLNTAAEFGWHVQAWAVFQNHYHVIASCPEPDAPLSKLFGKVHACSSRELNRLDTTPGRQVWHQFRDTKLTHVRSYFARMAYVHRNPVKHGLVSAPEMYEWCSADWFHKTAEPAFVNTVLSFKTDRVNVDDDY